MMGLHNRSLIKGYYFITDSALSTKGNENDVREAARAGVTIFQYRNKDGSTRQMVTEARMLRALCPGALFLINDRIDIAMAIGANGVHLGQDDMPYTEARNILGKDAIIGITVHDVREAIEAEKIGADYIGVSPIYSTTTKTDAGKPAGPNLLREVRRAVNIPVVAIGGINLGNVKEVIKSGADAVCAISAVVASNNVYKSIQDFQSTF